MYLLELFSGTGSVGAAFRRRGWTVHSLDADPNSPNLAYCVDIMDFDPSTCDVVYDAVHASPPCTMYSLARTTARTPRDLEGADALVRRTLEIIDYFWQRNPNLIWTLENPQTGLLKTREVVAGLPFVDADYCCYSTFGYRKRTRFWTNADGWEPQLCPGPGRCLNMEGSRHRAVAQRGDGWTLRELYRIPDALCDSLAEYCDSLVRSNAQEEAQG